MKERWQGLGLASALLGQLPCFVLDVVQVLVLVFPARCFAGVLHLDPT